VAAFIVPRSINSLAFFWFPLAGFFSGVFALFTMYLPPLFPTLLRTTGAGFCYNIGRVAAAVCTIVFGLLSPGERLSRSASVGGRAGAGGGGLVVEAPGREADRVER
jgi:hypothetical protein